ncbi:GntR family transcriptional regulator [Desulfitibacter alkalitolerans]|uniref:GntR family transcriptional regulator n=1 Tax=Desulfitibacter alkalitolerans TaxID=264641 RepID=UPI0004833AFB|nr:GntR family transcriptional regulator [Desulfitibacter alkalitolerans]
MIIKIDLQSEIPIYTQLQNSIIEGIVTGELKPGEALPSVRNMASDIGINMHTVNKAYNLLRQEGFIQSHRQKGVVINPDGMPQVTEEYLEKLKQVLGPIIAEALCRGMEAEDFNTLCSGIYSNLQEKRRQV